MARFVLSCLGSIAVLLQHTGADTAPDWGAGRSPDAVTDRKDATTIRDLKSLIAELAAETNPDENFDAAFSHDGDGKSFEESGLQGPLLQKSDAKAELVLNGSGPHSLPSNLTSGYPVKVNFVNGFSGSFLLYFNQYILTSRSDGLDPPFRSVVQKAQGAGGFQTLAVGGKIYSYDSFFAEYPNHAMTWRTSSTGAATDPFSNILSKYTDTRQVCLGPDFSSGTAQSYILTGCDRSNGRWYRTWQLSGNARTVMEKMSGSGSTLTVASLGYGGGFFFRFDDSQGYRMFWGGPLATTLTQLLKRADGTGRDVATVTLDPTSVGRYYIRLTSGAWWVRGSQELINTLHDLDRNQAMNATAWSPVATSDDARRESDDGPVIPVQSRGETVNEVKIAAQSSQVVYI